MEGIEKDIDNRKMWLMMVGCILIVMLVVLLILVLIARQQISTKPVVAEPSDDFELEYGTIEKEEFDIPPYVITLLDQSGENVIVDWNFPAAAEDSLFIVEIKGKDGEYYEDKD